MNKSAKLLISICGAGLVLFIVAAYFLVPRGPAEITKYARAYDRIMKEAKADGVPTTRAALYSVKLDDPRLGAFVLVRLLQGIHPLLMQYCLDPKEKADFDTLWKGTSDDVMRLTELGDCPAFGDAYPSESAKGKATSIEFADSTGRAMGMLGYQRMKVGDDKDALRLFEAGLKLGAAIESTDANRDVFTAGMHSRQYADTYLLIGSFHLFKDPRNVDVALKMVRDHHPIPDLEHRLAADAITAYQHWRDEFKKQLANVQPFNRDDVDSVPYEYAKDPRFLMASDAFFVESLHACIKALRNGGTKPVERARAADARILAAANDRDPLGRGLTAAFSDIHLEEMYKYYSFGRTALLTAHTIAKQYRREKKIPMDLKALGQVAIDPATGKPIEITRTSTGFVLSNNLSDKDYLKDTTAPDVVYSEKEYGGTGDMLFLRVSLRFVD